MSAGEGRGWKLTEEDLDRFLEVPAQDESVTPYCESAAVLASFDPLALQPAGGEADARARADVLPRLRPMCELVTESDQRSSSTLSRSERRMTLKPLAARDRMQ